MRLADLEPRWIVGSPLYDGINRTGMGVSFDCPLHREHRLAVFFANPIDGGPPHRRTGEGWIPGTTEYPAHSPLWQRAGELLQSLTLTPSVDASGVGCWHGFIENGEVR
jgi:hypothetical protein